MASGTYSNSKMIEEKHVFLHLKLHPRYLARTEKIHLWFNQQKKTLEKLLLNGSEMRPNHLGMSARRPGKKYQWDFNYLSLNWWNTSKKSSDRPRSLSLRASDASQGKYAWLKQWQTKRSIFCGGENPGMKEILRSFTRMFSGEFLNLIMCFFPNNLGLHPTVFPDMKFSVIYRNAVRRPFLKNRTFSRNPVLFAPSSIPNLPEFQWWKRFLRQMLANIPYMEHRGVIALLPILPKVWNLFHNHYKRSINSPKLLISHDMARARWQCVLPKKYHPSYSFQTCSKNTSKGNLKKKQVSPPLRNGWKKHLYTHKQTTSQPPVESQKTKWVTGWRFFSQFVTTLYRYFYPFPLFFLKMFQTIPQSSMTACFVLSQLDLHHNGQLMWWSTGTGRQWEESAHRARDNLRKCRCWRKLCAIFRYNRRVKPTWLWECSIGSIHLQMIRSVYQNPW